MKNSTVPQPVEESIRHAGSRPQPPAEVREAARSAAYSAWQRKLKESTPEASPTPKSRLRPIWPMLAAAAALIITLGPGTLHFLTQTTPAPSVATIEAWFPAQMGAGTAVTAGEEITTRDGERMALQLAAGVSVRLDQGSRLAVLAANEIWHSPPAGNAISHRNMRS